MSLRRGALLLVPAAALAASGCLAAEPARRIAADPPGAAAVARAARPPVVMFLGDSYITGGRAAEPHETFAAEAARRLGWQVVIAGRGGTGFVTPGATDEPFHVLFTRQLAWRPAPDLVIVAGGHNDVRHPPPRVERAAGDLLTRIRARWPRTRLAVIGPIWGTGAPPPAALGVRDALYRASGRLGVPFIDPIGEGWITGDRRTGTGNATVYILPDRVHPTPAGHRHLGDRLAGSLRRLGLD